MLDTTENLIGLEIYTPDGIFIGTVDEIIINRNDLKADSLFLAEANPAVVEEGVSIAIPCRWIQSVGDIIILNYFPERIERT